MARKRIKKILPKTTIGETIESFGPGGGVGGRTRVTKASGPRLEKEFMSNVKSGKTPAPSKGLVKVDLQTANLLVKVLKKVNPKMMKILINLGFKDPAQLVQTLWAVVK